MSRLVDIYGEKDPNVEMLAVEIGNIQILIDNIWSFK